MIFKISLKTRSANAAKIPMGQHGRAAYDPQVQALHGHPASTGLARALLEKVDRLARLPAADVRDETAPRVARPAARQASHRQTPERAERNEGH